MCELKTIKFKGDNHQSFICGKLHSILWIMRKIQQKTAHALTELCVLCDIVTEHQITFIRSICTYIVSEKDAQTHSHTHTAEVCWNRNICHRTKCFVIHKTLWQLFVAVNSFVECLPSERKPFEWIPKRISCEWVYALNQGKLSVYTLLFIRLLPTPTKIFTLF